MEINRWLRNGPMLAAVGLIAFIPMTSMAAVERDCASAEQEPQCCATTAAPEARGLLNDMWRDAAQVVRQTDSLQILANSPSVDRSIQTEELVQIRADVADMENRLCRLEAIQGSLPSAEQQAILEASPLVRSMANDTNDAIGDLDASIPYGGYTQMLHTEAQTVSQNSDTGEHVAALYQRMQSRRISACCQSSVN